MSSIKLYGYWRSSCSYRVRIALNIKGLSFEYIREHKSPEYTALNPSESVPLLITGETKLRQSSAIIEWIEETYPENSLLPGTPVERAQSRAIACMIGSDIQPLQNMRVLQSISSDPVARAEHAKTVITQGFQKLEKVLQETAATFCVGNQVSIADIFLVPQVYNALRFQVDMDKFPLIQRVYNACIALESFIKAAPSNQPDAEKQ